MNEEWIQFTDGYMVNRLGQVKTIERRRGRNNKLWKSIIMSPGNCKGYNFVRLHSNGRIFNKYVHRLVAEAFIPNPENLPWVNHKNGIKNDNRLENLEWCTPSYNIKHSFDVLNRDKPDHNGIKHPRARLTFNDVQYIIEAFKSKKATARELASQYGLAHRYVYNIVAQKTWKQDHANSK